MIFKPNIFACILLFFGISFYDKLFVTLLGVYNVKCEHTFCAYEDFNAMPSLNISEKDTLVNEMGIIYLHNKTVRCPLGKNICFTAWKGSTNSTLLQIMKQGCWTDPADSSCFKNKCLSDGPPKGRFSSLFCCCQGSYCNVDFKQVIINQTGATNTSERGKTLNKDYNMQKEKRKYIIINLGMKILIIVVAIIIIGVIASVYITYHRKAKKAYFQYSPTPTKDDNNFNINNVHLIDIIDRGRYGTIWKASYSKEEEIVVKVFKHAYQSYFLNERDIYRYPHMQHPNILKFIGDGDNVDSEKHLEHWLALAYIQPGCIQNYLKENTVLWAQFINIFSSISAGLSYLQKMVVKDGKAKPPIAHRDLNTRNILITDGGNRCIIGDLGFAYPLITNQCKVVKEGAAQKVNGATGASGEKTLVDVGTIRYMAPEVLEGSINLRDCEAALKQVDVYALALVMWEVAVRCTDLYREGENVINYQLPFQNEVGLHPTFEDMQILVVRNKCRPSFPSTWKAGNEAIALCKETLEHCWDHDAEARLSAFCVEERVSELRFLWAKINEGDLHTSGNTIASSMELSQESHNPKDFMLQTVENFKDIGGGSQAKRALQSSTCMSQMVPGRLATAIDSSERGNSTTETYLISSNYGGKSDQHRQANQTTTGTSFVSTDANDQSDKRLLPSRKCSTTDNALLPGGAITYDDRGLAQTEVINHTYNHRNIVTSLLMRPLKGLLSKATSVSNNRGGHYNNYLQPHHSQKDRGHFL